MQEKGDAGATSDSLMSNQFQRVSGPRNFRGDDFANHHFEPEIAELYSRSVTQEEEILLLRKQVTDAFIQELQLLNEKHILERRLSDLRMVSILKDEYLFYLMYFLSSTRKLIHILLSTR